MSTPVDFSEFKHVVFPGRKTAFTAIIYHEPCKAGWRIDVFPPGPFLLLFIRTALGHLKDCEFKTGIPQTIIDDHLNLIEVPKFDENVVTFIMIPM